MNGATFTCGEGAEVARGATCTASPSGDAGATSTFECTLGARGANSLKTTYTCPSQASFDKCSAGDSTSCSPKDKKPGTVGYGQPCNHAFVAGSPGDEYELADDCAPDAKYGGRGAAKGTYCAFGYCTHDCSQASECADLAAGATCGDTNVCEK